MPNSDWHYDEDAYYARLDRIQADEDRAYEDALLDAALEAELDLIDATEADLNVRREPSNDEREYNDFS